MSSDDAYVTPIVALRPLSPDDPGSSRPCPALVVRFPGTPSQRETVLRGLLRLGWEIAGSIRFEPEASPRAAVTLTAGQVRIETGGETLYEGSLPLAPDLDGAAWAELAQAQDEALVFVTVGDTPIMTEDDADRAAQAGHLVGATGLLAHR